MQDLRSEQVALPSDPFDMPARQATRTVAILYAVTLTATFVVPFTTSFLVSFFNALLGQVFPDSIVTQFGLIAGLCLLPIVIFGFANGLFWKWPANHQILELRELGGDGRASRHRLIQVCAGIAGIAAILAILVSAMGCPLGGTLLQIIEGARQEPILWLWIPAIILLLSIAEEAMFRGAILGLLRRHIGPLPTLLVTTVLFVAAHWERLLLPDSSLIVAALALTVLGLLAGASALLFRSIIPAITIHVCWNVLFVLL